MTNVDLVPGYTSPTGTVPKGAAPGVTGTPPANEGLFSGAAGETQDPAKTAQLTTLEQQLNAYKAQKQQLEEQLKQYQIQYEALEKKDKALKDKEKALTGEIADLEAQRQKDEEEAVKLKEQYDANNVKLLDLIKKMNEKIAETLDQTDKAAQEQNKKVDAVTKEAFEKYEKGELTEDQIQQYIADKTGSGNLVKQLTSSALGIIESMNTQIMGIISQMAKSLKTINDKKMKIEAATTKINSNNKELDVIQNERLAVEDEMSEVQGNITSTNNQITAVDNNITRTQSSIDSLSVSSGESTPPDSSSGEVTPPVTDPDVEETSPAAPRGSVEVVTTEIGNATKNPFISITETIDYTGFSSMLNVLMEQNKTTIADLRQRLQEDGKDKANKKTA